MIVFHTQIKELKLEGAQHWLSSQQVWIRLGWSGARSRNLALAEGEGGGGGRAWGEGGFLRGEG